MSTRPAMKWARKVNRLYPTQPYKVSLVVETCEVIEEALLEQADLLRETMPCGHPLAALNCHEVGPDTGRQVTMFCRSCSFDGARALANAQKEKSND